MSGAETPRPEWVDSLPKVELHLHLDACLSFEVARQLDRTEASVRNLLHRALAKFARHIEDASEADA